MSIIAAITIQLTMKIKAFSCKCGTLSVISELHVVTSSNVYTLFCELVFDTRGMCQITLFVYARSSLSFSWGWGQISKYGALGYTYIHSTSTSQIRNLNRVNSEIHSTDFTGTSALPPNYTGDWLVGGQHISWCVSGHAHIVPWFLHQTATPPPKSNLHGGQWDCWSLNAIAPTSLGSGITYLGRILSKWAD